MLSIIVGHAVLIAVCTLVSLGVVFLLFGRMKTLPRPNPYPIEDWMRCPDCYSYIGEPGQSSYRCLDCHLKIGLDYGTQENPIKHPRRAPFRLCRADDANRDDQIHKPRVERVIPYGRRFLVVGGLLPTTTKNTKSTQG